MGIFDKDGNPIDINVLLDSIITTYKKAQMASKHSNDRSVGSKQQDRDCYYDYLIGVEDTVEVIKNYLIKDKLEIALNEFETLIEDIDKNELNEIVSTIDKIDKIDK